MVNNKNRFLFLTLALMVMSVLNGIAAAGDTITFSGVQLRHGGATSSAAYLKITNNGVSMIA